MAFVPRNNMNMTPSYSDLNWISNDYGGKNHCITIDYSTGSVLPNCFSGDTVVQTEDGLIRIDSLVGRTVRVPTLSGWRSAKFDCYGNQELWEVKLGMNTYRCTANHRWLIFSQSGESSRFVYTKDLEPNMLVPYTFYSVVEYDDDVTAIRHGFIYGDGSKYYKSDNYTYAYICGYKKTFMPVWFEGCSMKESTYDGGSMLVVKRQLGRGKQLPDIHEPDSYIYNFLRGYFAADGTVDKGGTTYEICSSKQDELEKVRSLCCKIGLRVSKIRTAYGSGYDGYHYSYYLSLYKTTLSEKFFLNPIHKERFLEVPKKVKKFTHVKSCKPLHVVEPVYCASEPDTTTITLEGGELTGQCTGYAWGRWCELLGTTPKLSTGNAGDWYGYTADGYQRGKTPQLGAILCFGESGNAGHVAIVEEIHADGSILCSQSGWGWVRFDLETGYPPSYIVGQGPGHNFYFQGFIYCPSVAGMEDKLSLFLKEAESHVGERGDWTWAKSGLGRGQHWCAAFVVACGLAVGGIIDVIIPRVFGAGDMPRQGCPTETSKQLGGRWIRGPYYGAAVGTPQPGDLILFRWNRYPNAPDDYYSDHVGIVTRVSGGVVYTVEGNTGGSSPWNSTVTKNNYSLSDGRINGYYRPDWAKVGASVNNLLTGIGGNLYDMVNTREDAIIREVGFMRGTEPSIKISNTRLSVINYTTLLGQFFQGSIFSGVYGSGVAIDASAINNTVCRAILEYLTGKGFNAATACGIAGNLQQEMSSSWDIGQTIIDADGGLAGGICMWNDTYGNLSRMIKYVGSNWRNNLTGQLDYLWYDMTVGQASFFKSRVQSNYGVNETIVNMLMRCPNTEAGVRQAADIFVRCYERPADLDNQSVIRGNNGVAIWNSLVNQLV